MAMKIKRTRRPKANLSLTCLVVLMSAITFAGHVLAAEEEVAEESGKAQYVRFSPDFVVNLDTPDPHFLMVTVQGMAREEAGVLAAKHHMPAIRHYILMELSQQTPESLASAELKQELMNEVLGQIQEYLLAETGKPSIEAVFFTDFVLE